ncbi:hypothetical protein BJX70DRAFT_383102 [Aspergillus crustosus]
MLSHHRTVSTHCCKSRYLSLLYEGKRRPESFDIQDILAGKLTVTVSRALLVYFVAWAMIRL